MKKLLCCLLALTALLVACDGGKHSDGTSSAAESSQISSIEESSSDGTSSSSEVSSIEESSSDGTSSSSEILSSEESSSDNTSSSSEISSSEESSSDGTSSSSEVSSSEESSSDGTSSSSEVSSSEESTSESIEESEESEESSSSQEPVIDMSTVTLRLTKKTYDIENGQSVPLEIEFTADGEDLDISLLYFKSSNENVVTVSDDGVITGVSDGKASITIFYGTKFTKATINVTMREYRVDVSQDSLFILTGNQEQVSAKVYLGLTEMTDATLSWESSNPAVATVENGLITAVAYGKTVITVSCEGAIATIDVTVTAEILASNVNTFSEEYINIYGRTYLTSGRLCLDHAASAVEVGVVGNTLSVNMYATATSYARVFVDGEEISTRIKIDSTSKEYLIADNMGEGYHTVRIVKATEESNAQWKISSFKADKFFVVPEKSDLKIEFIGDSISAGYGVLGAYGDSYSVDNSDCSKSYAYVAADILDADYSVVAWSGICTKLYYWCNLNMATLYKQVSNSNKKTYAFDTAADVVVVNLGTNEASYIQEGGANTAYADAFSSDYAAFLTTVREKNPDAYIICLYGMMSDSVNVSNGIRTAVASLEDEKIVYNPFEFEPNTDGAGSHPNSLGQKTWGEALAAYIQTLF